MVIGDKGIALIKSFESCRLEAYKDVVGIWTIGYGATGPDITQGLVWTQDECDNRLKKDLCKTSEGVTALLKTAVNQNQFDALCSFAYNLGLGALSGSTLLRCINKHNSAAAPSQFLLWNHAGGKVVDGLTRRRQAEADLFAN
jgi:lysozyme